MNKINKLKLVFLVVTVFCLFELLNIIILFTQNNFNSKSIYEPTFSVIAEESQPQQGGNIGVLKGMVSINKSHLLLVTSLNIDVTQYQEIGYYITKDEEQAVKYSSDTYYTGITINTKAEPVTYTMAEIYPDITAVGMIIKEIEYDPSVEYSIQPYIISNDNQTTYGTMEKKEKSCYTVEAENLNPWWNNTVLNNGTIKYFVNDEGLTSKISTNEEASDGKYISGFNESVAMNNGESNGITFHVWSDVASTADVIVRVASGEVQTHNGSWVPTQMKTIDLSDSWKVYYGYGWNEIKDNTMTINSTAIIQGASTTNPDGDNALWCSWTEVNLGTIQVHQGSNLIRIVVTKSGCQTNFDKLSLQMN